MQNIFFEIAIVICLAAFLAVIFRSLKQPAILAYILTGIIVGPLGSFNFSNKEVLHLMAQFGITLLLFMVGLELKLSGLRSVGKVAFIAGISQVVFTSFTGYLISLSLGFSSIASLYIGIALTFSSTIIIIKLLSDKKDLNSLYGKISVGILLVQDFFVILILIFLSGFDTLDGGALSIEGFIITLIKGIILFTVVAYLSKTLLPRLVNKIARSPETLFLFGVAWAFGLAAIVSSESIGFSVEIGGFLAGLSLANSSENFQIASRIRPLRDFFITIFFVVLGMNLKFVDIGAIFLPSIIFSVFVLIANPIIVMIIMGIMGYRKRTSFLSGLTFAQISEFSLILIFLGNKLGHVSDKVVSLITVVGIITFTVSTYMVVNGSKLYLYLSRFLSIFEKKHTKEDINQFSEEMENLKDHVVLVGGDQMGQSILRALEDLGKEIVVIDFDPAVVDKLKDKKVHMIFGDISDLDIQEKARLDTAKLVISTVHDIEDNIFLLKQHKHEKIQAKVIVMALDGSDAKILYEEGADYVILPHLAGGKQIAEILKENNFDKFASLKAKDMAYL